MINFEKFLEQKIFFTYKKDNYLSSLEQMLFLLNDANFSQEDLIKTISTSPQGYKFNPHASLNVNVSALMKAYCFGVDFTPASSLPLEQKLSESKIKKAQPLLFYGTNKFKETLNFADIEQFHSDPKIQHFLEHTDTHLASQILSAARSGLSILYFERNRLSENLMKDKVNELMSAFFELTDFLPMEKFPNNLEFVPQSYMGKNSLMTYHQSLLFFATHNFMGLLHKENKERLINLLDRVIPEGSIHEVSCSHAFSSLFYNEKNKDIFDFLSTRFNKAAFITGALFQDTHQNFYLGLNMLSDNLEDVLAYLNKNMLGDQQTLSRRIIVSLSNIGMSNNAYYKKIFNTEEKLKFAKTMEKIDPTNELLRKSLVGARGSTNWDIPFLPTHNINNDFKLFSLICSNYFNNEDCENLLSHFTFADEDLKDLTQALENMQEKIAKKTLHFLGNHLPKEQLFFLMNANSLFFNELKNSYRDKSLKEKLVKNNPSKTQNNIRKI